MAKPVSPKTSLGGPHLGQMSLHLSGTHVINEAMSILDMPTKDRLLV